MNEKITREKMMEGIRPDGTVEGEMFQTNYQPLEGIELADGYLRVTMDIEGAFAETRIPFTLLESAGFVREPAGDPRPGATP